MFSTAPRRRLVLLAAPVAVLALALAGCSSSPSADSTSGDGATKIAAVIKGLDNPFFQAMEDGITETAEAAGVDVTVQAAADIGDTTGQADKLTTLSGQDFGCFIVNPISGTNLVQSLAPIAAAGKPIINIDQPIDEDAAEAADITPATYIGTDNEAAGEKAGDYIASLVDAGGEVAIIGGISGDVTSAARVDGFKDAVDGALEIVQEDAADWKREIALTKATDIIAANPDIVAFFAANDDMGLGIVKAVENSGKTGEIVVVSVDGNQDALESVEAGGLAATVAQYPYAIGSLGVQACQVALDGGDLPDDIESPTALVNADNAADAIASFPQPFEGFDNPLADQLDE
ncbi:substrate-binding domain-containing protein [Microbacterium sp. zg.B48]|uniref:sugar ABC transporter substrate-binding protein n=1 Tax=Microbacterium sp. zg.B48 TaxID=2969408 RepID=UPI00214C70A3|nr:substrate-binding domain-containing protein [Microbacterium sp. zg.B48]MCR2762494.1 substrate-binding domain-containing protein [Microbacterium sp. zg.B48]